MWKLIASIGFIDAADFSVPNVSAFAMTMIVCVVATAVVATSSFA